MNTVDIADISEYTNPHTSLDYIISSDKLNVKGEVMSLIDLLNIGIKGDIKIIRVYVERYMGDLYLDIWVTINNWFMNIYITKAELTNGIGVKTNDDYDSVSMKYEDKIITFNFIKDRIIKNVIIKDCKFLSVSFRIVVHRECVVMFEK